MPFSSKPAPTPSVPTSTVLNRGEAAASDQVELRRPRVMVVSPYAHGTGHYPVFARDISVGFAKNGATVALIYPRPMPTKLDFFGAEIIRTCLSEHLSALPAWLHPFWTRLQPHHQCLLWLILKVPAKNWDLVYWTDFDSGNQHKLWTVTLARIVGLYPHRTSFTEHYSFQWRRPISRRLHRYLSLDQLRVGDFDMVMHSQDLLTENRRIMEVADLGRYVPWGLWPIPASNADRAIARAALGLAADARVLLIFGWQAVHRKNIDALALAARQFHSGAKLTLLFVGKHKESEPHPFKEGTWPVEVRLDQDFVSEEKTRQYFEACDGVWANYRGFIGASGVLQQSMSHGRLALCQYSGEIGELCRRHDLGLIVPSESARDLKTVLDSFIDLPAETQARYEANAVQAADHYVWSTIARDILNNPAPREFGPPPLNA